jgi:AcrR family transcriptional regulator
MASPARRAVEPAAADGASRVSRARLPRPRQRQQEILDTAAELFYEKGYENTTIQEIADAVGILKGSLYYYIESKEDLLLQIVRQVSRDFLPTIDRVGELDAPPLTKIRAFVVADLLHNLGNAMKMAVVFRSWSALDAPHREQMLVEGRKYDDFLRALVVEGQRDGSICPDVDPTIVGLGIFGVINWVYHWYREGDGSVPEEIAREYANFVLAGLACDPATHRPGHRDRVGALPLGALARLTAPPASEERGDRED